MKFNLDVVVGRVDRLSSCAGNEMSFQEGTKHSFLSFRLFGPQEGRTRAGAGGPGYSNSFCLLQKLCYCNLRYKGDSDRLSHRKWRETKQQPSIVISGHQISCCLFSLHFLDDILRSGTVHDYCTRHDSPSLLSLTPVKTQRDDLLNNKGCL